MMSVGLPEDRARELVGLINPTAAAYGLTVGCINSPSNVTISGEEGLIDQLKAQLDEQKVFARKLHVSLAYHSRQMEAIGAKYASVVGALSSDGDRDTPGRPCVPMVSSVTGERIAASQLTDPSYWARNMVFPVQFSKALTTMCTQSHTALVKRIDRSNRFAVVVDHLVEVGPHAALQGPIRETLRQIPRGKSLGYTSILRRGESAASCTLRALGELYCLGVPVALREANNEPQQGVETNPPCSPSLLTSLPEYPFDHSQQFGHEGRLSRNYRLRPHAPSELLGVRDRDWDASEARWQHFIRFSEMPWVEQHVINGTVLYPGTGMLAMAVEAARQLVQDGHDGEIESYTLRDVHFEGAMALSSDGTGTEVQTCLRRVNAPARSGGGDLTFEFTIRTPPADHTAANEWTLNCRGFVSTKLCVPEGEEAGWEEAKTAALRQKTAGFLSGLAASCGRPVPSYRMYRFLRECGYDYGSDFQLAHDQRCHSERREATAEVQLFQDKHGEDDHHVFHPTSLDAMMHICFTAFSLGGTVPMATSIPSHLSRMWISSRGLRWRPDQQSVTASVAIHTPHLRRGFAASGGALARGSGELSLWYEGLELTSVTQAPALPSLPNPKQWYMNTECKVAVDKLTKSDTVNLLEHLHQPEEEDISPFFQDLERLVRLSLELLRHAVEADPDFVLGPRGSWKAQYWNWAQDQLASTSLHARQNQCPWSAEAAGIETKQQQQQELQSLMDRLREVNHVGRVYSEVAANLGAMFRGDVEPLQLLIHSGLLKEYYQELAGYRCSRQVATYMDLIAHQTPGMTILEVGGGTGSATRSFVRALRSGQEASNRDVLLTQPGALRCKRYDFTDISSAFIEGAQEEFAPFREQMTFGVLDIENDLAGQGFEENTYDVVVADNVLHATADLRRSLRSIRKALKPGGRLLMHEPLKQSGGLLGFVFGLFAGWWLGSGDGRTLAPSITPEAWHAVLRETGFSGTDMVLRDFDDDLSHHLGWVVATAVGGSQGSLNGTHSKSRQTHRATIMVDGSSAGQVALAEKLHPLRDRLEMDTIRVLGIDTAAGVVGGEMQRSGADDQPDSLVILLVDFEKPFLSSLDESSWSRLTYLFRTCRRLLWVSSNGGSSGGNPDQGLIDGLARSLRAEYYELHLVTLALDTSSRGGDAASLVSRVAEEMMSRAARQPYEQEYVEIKGRLHTRRLVEARGLKLAMDAKLTPHDVVRTPLDGSSYFEASTASPGVGSATSKFFVRCGPPPALPEAEDAVSITVRAVVLLQTEHRAVAALGRTSQDHDPASAGYYCAGVVVASSQVDDAAFRPGDRVLAVCRGPLGSHVRVASRLVAKIPPQLPFADACARAPFLMAAH
jgi:acyl transferase domain-containing protein